jgi:hypothetical protein
MSQRNEITTTTLYFAITNFANLRASPNARDVLSRDALRILGSLDDGRNGAITSPRGTAGTQCFHLTASPHTAIRYADFKNNGQVVPGLCVTHGYYPRPRGLRRRQPA